MSKITWTDIQVNRLNELNADSEIMSVSFDSNEDRNRSYQELEKKLVKQTKAKLDDFLTKQFQTKLCKLETRLTDTLNSQGFSRVVTPTLISKAQLAKMSIGEDHPLFNQVYWVSDKQCLRPMLAPNLYQLMYELARAAKKPLRFFEIGSCFRKESSTASHSSEFTMLNLVETGLPEEARYDRLIELGKIITDAAGLEDCKFEKETSAVYGDTVDIVCGEGKLEIASGAMGPHRLDHAWRITDTWVGLGFGLERMVMLSEGCDTISKWGKSLSYLDGVRLNF